MRLTTTSLSIAATWCLTFALGVRGDGPRKTLNLGVSHPHASFTTSLPQWPRAYEQGLSVDPFELAKRFVEEVISPHTAFAIRPDSYTDKSTGITHVYVRQVINGVQVADGDININILDGTVISYGYSFYEGNPTSMRQTRSLADKLLYQPNHGQIAMSTKLTSYPGLPTLEDETTSIKSALLQFMTSAASSNEVVQDILTNYESHFDTMAVSDLTNVFASDRLSPALVHNVPDTVSPVKVYLAYSQTHKAGTLGLALVWKFEVEMNDNWYEVAVTVEPPHQIVSIVDWVSDHPLVPVDGGALYYVFPFQVNDPLEGKRTVEFERLDTLASPLGWHSLPSTHDPSLNGSPSEHGSIRKTKTTFGNNVFAQENWVQGSNWITNYRPDGSERGIFIYDYDPKPGNQSVAVEEAKTYINASITHLFYISNLVHDLYYRYGFDEVSGNFQQYNFGKGGKENDAVITHAQDGSSLNGADFATPPDGQNGRCRMYLWNAAYPYRDGVFDASVLVHELSHGLGTRLTGGPANSGCIGSGESGGMGEGWSDFLAMAIRSKPKVTDYPSGVWVGNKPEGMRHYPYSLNQTVNPVTYETLNVPAFREVHAVGEVWAEMLWVMMQLLVKKHGFSVELFPPLPLKDGTIPDGDFYRSRRASKDNRTVQFPKHGNTLAIQLVITGMKLQPCRPSFFSGRDAIIQADDVLTGGENFCILWDAFASRGLGPDAKYVGQNPWGGGGRRINDFKVPPKCLGVVA